MRKWLSPVLLLGAYLFSAAVYSRLPARVPIHWGLHGPDAWAPRAVGALLLPSIGVVVWLFLRWVPSIDPKRASYDTFRGAYEVLVLSVVGFMVVIHVATLGSALGWQIRVEQFVPGVVGVLFVVIGGILPRVAPNWFVGIRTPWTLSNDVVWKHTHSVASYLMIVAGVLTFLAALISATWALVTLLVSSGVLVIGVIAYSYLDWKRHGGKGGR